METTQEAVDKLAALVDIGEYMLSHGYTGVQGNSCNCPVAQYLTDKTGIPHVVCNILIIGVRNDQFQDEVTVPQNVRDFIERFDRGDYPELIAS